MLEIELAGRGRPFDAPIERPAIVKARPAPPCEQRQPALPKLLLEARLLRLRKPKMKLPEHVAEQHRGARASFEHGVQPHAARQERLQQDVALLDLEAHARKTLAQDPARKRIRLEHE